MLARKTEGKRKRVVLELCFEHTLAQNVRFFHVRENYPAAVLPACPAKNLLNAFLLRTKVKAAVLRRERNNGAAFFDCACFVCGNFFNRISEKLCVVERNASEHRDERRRYNVGAVVPASDSGLKHNKVAFLLAEIHKSNGKNEFKKRRLKLLRQTFAFFPDCFGKAAKIRFGNIP